LPVPLAPLLALLALHWPAVAAAVPGPDSVAVVANANLPESVALAERYVGARQVPPSRLCALDLPEGPDMDLPSYQEQLLEPLLACLRQADALEAVEALLLVRGVPLRLRVPVGEEAQWASVAAALGVWRSELDDGTPVLGQPPGSDSLCGGSPCTSARWTNPFREGPFAPGWSAHRYQVRWRPLLVTMLHGRSFADAELLLDSALRAEEEGGAQGTFLFMDGADPARGVLDSSYDRVIAELQARGFADVRRVPFDTDLSGLSLAALFTGTSALGDAIEGNRYAPGALVDNVTSLGAVPVNFRAEGEAQVSIARWVAQGVAGVHGATAEPLNNVFPDRALILDYVDGATLAESFHRHLPRVYWQNLVLGDPMAAPYAVRPQVTLLEPAEGQEVARSAWLSAEAVDAADRGAPDLTLYVDGRAVAVGEGEVRACVGLPAGAEVHVLAVAQAQDDGSPGAEHRPKGWVATTMVVGDAPGPCGGDGDVGPRPDLDGGVVDTADAGEPGPEGMDGAVPDGGDPVDWADLSGGDDGGPAPVPDAGPGSGAAGGSGGGSDEQGCACAGASSVGGPLGGTAWRWLPLRWWGAVFGARGR